MKFSIRDLLLVTVIAAVSLGWGLDRWRVNSELAQLRMEQQKIEEISRWFEEKTGLKVESDEFGVRLVQNRPNSHSPASIPPKP